MNHDDPRKLHILFAMPTQDDEPIMQEMQGTEVAVSRVETKEAVEDWLASNKADFIIIDLAQRDEALDCLTDLRREGFEGGILVASETNALADRLAALRLGAQDFLLKPLNAIELRIRMQTLVGLEGSLHRNGRGRVIANGPLSLDIKGCRVSVNGVTTHLTPSETHILASLLRRHGEVVSKQEILEELHSGHHPSSKNNIEVMISSIRRKLAQAKNFAEIKTQWGIGYYLEISEAV